MMGEGGGGRGRREEFSISCLQHCSLNRVELVMVVVVHRHLTFVLTNTYCCVENITLLKLFLVTFFFLNAMI